MNKVNWFGVSKKTPIKSSPFFKPVKLPTKKSVRKIKKRNLTWPQAQVRYPKLKPFRDADRDGKLNMFDCKPFDKKRHSAMLRADIERRLDLNDARDIGGSELYSKEAKGYLKRKNLKTISKKELIKVFEKNPDLIKKAESARISARNIGKFNDFESGQYVGGRYYPGDVQVNAIQIKRKDINKVLKHELEHKRQDEEREIDSLKKESKKILTEDPSTRDAFSHYKDEDVAAEVLAEQAERADYARDNNEPSPETLTKLDDQ